MPGMTVKVLIADDESIARRRLCALCDATTLATVVGEAGSGVETLNQIEALRPDLVLLDIAMPDLNGLMIAEKLATMSTRPAIIFCTAYDAHALAAFDLSAVDYLLKPVGLDRLTRALDKVRAAPADAPTISGRASPPLRLDHLWAPHRDGMVRLDLAEVLRIDAEGDYARLTTARKSYMLHETLRRLEERLDPLEFVRLRRSVIARASIIEDVRHVGLGAWEARLSDGAPVRVGPTYWKELKVKLQSGLLN